MKNEDLIAVPREVLAAANYIIQGSAHAGSNTAARMREYALAFPISKPTPSPVEVLREALTALERVYFEWDGEPEDMIHVQDAIGIAKDALTPAAAETGGGA